MFVCFLFLCCFLSPKAVWEWYNDLARVSWMQVSNVRFLAPENRPCLSTYYYILYCLKTSCWRGGEGVRVKVKVEQAFDIPSQSQDARRQTDADQTAHTKKRSPVYNYEIPKVRILFLFAPVLFLASLLRPSNPRPLTPLVWLVNQSRSSSPLT